MTRSVRWRTFEYFASKFDWYFLGCHTTMGKGFNLIPHFEVYNCDYTCHRQKPHFFFLRGDQLNMPTQNILFHMLTFGTHLRSNLWSIIIQLFCQGKILLVSLVPCEVQMHSKESPTLWQCPVIITTAISIISLKNFLSLTNPFIGF